MSVTGRSLDLFFVDGRPEGMLTAEVFHWTGHVLRFPRIQLAIVTGHATNGHVAWTTDQGMTFADWDAPQVEGATA